MIVVYCPYCRIRSEVGSLIDLDSLFLEELLPDVESFISFMFCPYCGARVEKRS